MAVLLGEDGLGYELARRMEQCGAWRAWLGDAAYAAFAHFLTSPAAWEAFLTASPAASKAHLHLQLRARALLYDKASIALFLRPSSSGGFSISNLNPSYLQLHGDDIYYSLEDDQQDGVQHLAQTRSGSRYSDPENPNSSQRRRHEEWSDSWYNQFSERHRLRHHRFPYGEKESHRRTSEGMSAYVKLRDLHKRKRKAFKEDNYVGAGDPLLENGSSVHSKIVSDVINSTDEEITFFPEMMFPSNCVPDTALLLTNGTKENQKVEVYGVLDNLPAVVSRNPAMIERFGIIPEYHKMGSKYRGKDGSGGVRKPLGQEQASQMTHKAVARLLESMGFEGGTEVSMEVLSEIFSSHICKLGRILKLLSDSYKKQFSSIDLIKMFLQTAGSSNFETLIETMKDGNKGFTHQTQQHVRALQPQHQNPLLQSQQIQRQLHPQMNMLHPQIFQQQQQQQQQWDRLRQRQISTPRGSVMIMDKDQPMVDVKIENMLESSIDNPFSTLNKHQLQLRHQQAMANHLLQSGQQFKQLPSVQIPQLQAQNAYNMRTPPVKVEAFNELMGGDSTLKHEPEHNKLTSPPK
ncbi:uncharacterized protein LOC103712060 isoform X2 [Phoenix dactylifera]|uniref:Uncharacterized protein LOC103712060 isoform X2 n=1 Tax=Phoenix dactylifera TaxID=42345 RepID=A0A8B7CD11_PHODC|nr:uncharacterized protein LOC103712060 isoform X2 [Phoenix dactylifera]